MVNMCATVFSMLLYVSLHMGGILSCIIFCLLACFILLYCCLFVCLFCLLLVGFFLGGGTSSQEEQ